MYVFHMYFQSIILIRLSQSFEALQIKDKTNHASVCWFSKNNYSCIDTLDYIATNV